MPKSASAPLVGLIMGSQSDWSTMAAAATLLEDLKIRLRWPSHGHLAGKVGPVRCEDELAQRYGVSRPSVREALKRLAARPIATLSLEAQEMHERRERIHRD